MEDTFSQDWEVYLVVTSDLRLASYTELATVCNVEDLHNMLEIIEAKDQFDEIARQNKKAQEGNR